MLYLSMRTCIGLRMNKPDMTPRHGFCGRGGPLIRVSEPLGSEKPARENIMMED